MMMGTDLPKESPEEIGAYFDRLWPLMRSITGAGLRQSLDILGEIVPLDRVEVPTGTMVHDWVIPQEWVVREAYVITPDGRRILDIRDNNLHLLNYSVPFRGTLTRRQLDEHLYSDDDPTAIPYLTSYYRKAWGFCISRNDRDALPEGDYTVVVDTDHVDGALSLAEAVLPGADPAEVLLSTYTCHPSLANNELSGPLVAAFLYRRLAALPSRRFTYRFVFAPETIGTIAFLARRGEHLRRHLAAGYVITCAGDAGPFTYKHSRRRDTLADRAALWALRSAGVAFSTRDFRPVGGADERQYCSPGYNFPVGSLGRTLYDEYPQYHTSHDNRDFISFAALRDSVDMYFRIMLILEKSAHYRNTVPFGEPQMGRRGLYRDIGTKTAEDFVKAMFWVNNFSEGEHDLMDIAERSGFDLDLIYRAASECETHGLLTRMTEAQAGRMGVPK